MVSLVKWIHVRILSVDLEPSPPLPVDHAMADQLDLFASPQALPEGFKFRREVISVEAENTLLAQIRELPFRDFEFHGYVGKRRTVSFGWTYDFNKEKLEPTSEIPDFLLGLRETAAAFATSRADELKQVLVTEYGATAGIGWHRDKAVFGEVIGISLLSSCQFRLRRRIADRWERITIEAEPRSAYLLSGPARSEWEHSIPPVNTRRYSVTYRTLGDMAF
jgi:alkylated DNA repair dioxygenase AlkB